MAFAVSRKHTGRFKDRRLCAPPTFSECGGSYVAALRHSHVTTANPCPKAPFGANHREVRCKIQWRNKKASAQSRTTVRILGKVTGQMGGYIT
jgi:hypothetical protein